MSSPSPKQSSPLVAWASRPWTRVYPREHRAQPDQARSQRSCLLRVLLAALATAGDVVFYGTMDGYFKALDARPDQGGKELFKYHVPSGIISQPTTFKGPDGKQYVAVLSGVGGWAGAVVAGDLDIRDPTSALGFVNAMKELPNHTTKGGSLHVFALP